MNVSLMRVLAMLALASELPGSCRRVWTADSRLTLTNAATPDVDVARVIA
jgi:hypothetical protein